MRRTIGFLLVAGFLAAAAVFIRFGQFQPRAIPLDRSGIQADTERLRERIKEPDPDYAPVGEVALERLTERDLGRLPFVAEAKLFSDEKKPRCRIIHIRDWHLVPREQFLADQHARRRQMSSEDDELLFQHLLAQVGAVQREQQAVLLALVKHHGLKRVLIEGLTAADMARWKEQIASLQEDETKLRSQLTDIRALRGGPKEIEARELERELMSVLAQHEEHLQEIGAAGRLVGSGGLNEVRPLDDAALLDAARPPPVSVFIQK